MSKQVLSRCRSRLFSLCVLALWGLGNAAHAADGLSLEPQRWQARIQLSRFDAADQPSDGSGAGSRFLSASVLGDYYLTGSGLGQGVRGGLRATGGLMLGPLSISQSGSGLTVGGGAYGLSPAVAMGQHINAGVADRNELGNALTYIGIGYSGSSLRGGWGFSADLGLVGNRSGLRLGNSLGNIDDALRDNRLMPVLQVGLSYRY